MSERFCLAIQQPGGAFEFLAGLYTTADEARRGALRLMGWQSLVSVLLCKCVIDTDSGEIIVKAGSPLATVTE